MRFAALSPGQAVAGQSAGLDLAPERRGRVAGQLRRLVEREAPGKWDGGHWHHGAAGPDLKLCYRPPVSLRGVDRKARILPWRTRRRREEAERSSASVVSVVV